MTKLENALIWLYVKTWGKFGDRIVEDKDLWNFDDVHLERAIMGLAYPRKKENRERVKVLTELIMEKFEDSGLAGFHKWSVVIHDEVIDSLPRNVEFDAVDEQLINSDQHLVKIKKWDPTSAYNASVKDWLFTRLDTHGYARASTVLSTESTTGYEWSVKLVGDPHFVVGIASKLNSGSLINNFDGEAILFHIDGPYVNIKRGSTIIHTGLKRVHSGDVISFKFQPVTKKLIIDRDGQYEIDLHDNINYFPVIQSFYRTATDAHLIP